MLSRADMRKVIQCMTNTAVAIESQVTETYNACRRLGIPSLMRLPAEMPIL